jgi:hypothetical protein
MNFNKLFLIFGKKQTLAKALKVPASRITRWIDAKEIPTEDKGKVLKALKSHKRKQDKAFDELMGE